MIKTTQAHTLSNKEKNIEKEASHLGSTYPLSSKLPYKACCATICKTVKLNNKRHNSSSIKSSISMDFLE